jgi:hypothetical protein
MIRKMKRLTVMPMFLKLRLPDIPVLPCRSRVFSRRAAFEVLEALVKPFNAKEFSCLCRYPRTQEILCLPFQEANCRFVMRLLMSHWVVFDVVVVDDLEVELFVEEEKSWHEFQTTFVRSIWC